MVINRIAHKSSTRHTLALQTLLTFEPRHLKQKLSTRKSVEDVHTATQRGRFAGTWYVRNVYPCQFCGIAETF